MKANLTIGLKDLTGNEVVNERGEVIILSKLLANQIMMGEAQDEVMAKWDLANKLNNANGEIDLGENEKQIIKKTCEGGRMTILVAGQIMKIINNAK